MLTTLANKYANCGAQRRVRGSAAGASGSGAGQRRQVAVPRRMSHELRTPLNANLKLHPLSHRGCRKVNTKQVETLDKVVFSRGRHLLGLIDDVLDISKIEAGALKLFIETNVNLAQETTAAADAARSLLGEKPRSSLKSKSRKVCR